MPSPQWGSAAIAVHGKQWLEIHLSNGWRFPIQYESHVPDRAPVPVLQSKLFDRNVMQAEEVARFAYRQFMTGKTMIVPGKTNWILVRSTRFLPRKIVTGIVRKMQSEKDSQ